MVTCCGSTLSEYAAQRVKFLRESAEKFLMEGILRQTVPQTKVDQLLMVISFLLFSLSAYQLSYYSGESTLQEGAVEIADITTSGTIRRRHARTLHWGSVTEMGKVYLGDIVYTPKETGAEVTWGENERLELEPETMVQFDEITLNRISITLIEGKVKGVSLGTPSVTLKKRKEIFRVLPYPMTSNMQLLNKDQWLESEKIKLDEELKTVLEKNTILEPLAKMSEIFEDWKSLTDFSLELLPPPPKKDGLSREHWITMAWTKIPLSNVLYQLEISRERGFEHVILHQTKNHEISIQLEDPGVYYWRVKAIQGKKQIASPVRTFTLVSPRKAHPAPDAE